MNIWGQGTTSVKANIYYSTDPTFANATGYDGNAITSIYLGRPWQNAPRTVYVTCKEPTVLASAGWQTWNVTPGLYAEYKCSGAGSTTSGRLTSISRQLTDDEATGYSLANIFAKTTPSIWLRLDA